MKPSTEPNPYAPPGDVRGSRKKKKRPKRRAPGENVKWIYGALALLNAVSFLALVLGLSPTATIREGLVTLVDGPLRLTSLALAPAWIYYAWSGLPLELRLGISPGGAVVRLFAPIYSLYWVFVVHARIGEALDTLLRSVDDRRRAPVTLAAVATVFYFVPTLMLLGGGGTYAWVVLVLDQALWMAYMIQCDALRRAVVGIRWSSD
jgi:hypothetical protein